MMNNVTGFLCACAIKFIVPSSEMKLDVGVVCTVHRLKVDIFLDMNLN